MTNKQIVRIGFYFGIGRMLSKVALYTASKVIDSLSNKIMKDNADNQEETKA